MYLNRILGPAVRVAKLSVKIGKNNCPKNPSTLYNSMQSLSKLTCIENFPADPMIMLKELLEAKAKKDGNPNPFMNIATLDEEYGVLNRTVVYRGLTDNHMTFVTEKHSRKYDNIKKNAKIAVTIFLGALDFQGSVSSWQIRVCGDAKELNPDQITALWNEEQPFAKIRSRICECGKPVDPNQLKEAHDNLLKAIESGKDTLPQTETYTAFKIVPKLWDFYKSEVDSIADRVEYIKDDSQEHGWTSMHVAA